MHILVTAGPTREYLDAVRFLSNGSSGRMGYAIAAEALRRHHHVTLVSGPVSITPPKNARLVEVVSAADMDAACRIAFPDCEAAVMASAVGDFRPVRTRRGKLKRADRPAAIELRPTRDICARLGREKGQRVLIGFAVEDRHGRKNAERKLRDKRCDAIVLNHLAAIGADRSEIEILRADAGWSGPFRGAKARHARRIVDLVESLSR